MPTAIVKKRITSTFLPHGVGHFLGLQVHDVGGLSRGRGRNAHPEAGGASVPAADAKDRAADVFTIEPGFYFIDTLLAELKKSENARYMNWTKIDSFRKFGGIRIEDDVVVTDTGHENLTRDAFAAVL